MLLINSCIGFIPKGTVDINAWPDPLAGPKALASLQLKTTNPLIKLKLMFLKNHDSINQGDRIILSMEKYQKIIMVEILVSIMELICLQRCT